MRGAARRLAKLTRGQSAGRANLGFERHGVRRPLPSEAVISTNQFRYVS